MFAITRSLAVVAALAILSVTQYASAQQNPYYFGMNVQLIYSFSGPALQVVSVTPGGPAAQAGLEPGDQITNVNGRGFNGAQDSFAAVRMLNSYVIVGGAAPAQAGAQAGLFVNPNPKPIAGMTVIDIRTGNYVSVNVNPTRRFGGGVGIPAQAGAGNGGK